MHAKHAEIFNMIQDLLENRDREDEEYIEEVKKMLNMMRICFSEEEDVMISNKYSDYDGHKECHKDILVNYVELLKLFNKEGIYDPIFQSLRNQLLPRITEHLTRMDHSFLVK